MANVNKVFLIGRLTRDPELRYTPSGTPVAEFGLAVSRQYVDTSGERKENTCFVDLVVWGKRGEVCNEYLSKGRQVYIEGHLDLSTWEGQDGQKRSKLRVVVDNFQFLDSGQRSPGAPSYKAPRENKAPAAQKVADSGSIPEVPSFLQDNGPEGGDDDLPF